MEKEFVFNPGDQVWLMHENRAVCGSIEKLFYVTTISCVNYTSISDNERYDVALGGRSLSGLEPKKLFRTKEDLLNSL